MKPSIKEMWVNALLSGDYSQTTGVLRSNDGYCCLGVLCDLYSQEVNRNWQGKRYTFSDAVDITETEAEEFNFDSFFYDDEMEHLPQAVVEWACLDNTNPSVQVEYTTDEGVYVEYVELSQLNDTGYDFKQIANYIQESL